MSSTCQASATLKIPSPRLEMVWPSQIKVNGRDLKARTKRMRSAIATSIRVKSFFLAKEADAVCWRNRRTLPPGVSQPVTYEEKSLRKGSAARALRGSLCVGDQRTIINRQMRRGSSQPATRIAIRGGQSNIALKNRGNGSENHQLISHQSVSFADEKMLLCTLRVYTKRLSSGSLSFVLKYQSPGSPRNRAWRRPVQDLHLASGFLAVAPGDLLDPFVCAAAGKEGDGAAAAASGDFSAVELRGWTGFARKFNQAVCAIGAEAASAVAGVRLIHE